MPIFLRTIFLLLLVLTCGATLVLSAHYLWLADTARVVGIESRIATPPGYSRIAADSSSFTHWLRGLPLNPVGAPVIVYDGSARDDQSVQNGVLDIDIGNRDLQQCADAAMRLRAEYLRWRGRPDEIAFRFTSGDTARWSRWIDGWRPEVDGNSVTWRRSAPLDSSYRNFRDYLDTVFMYAGSYSLQRDLPRRRSMHEMMPGDLFIDGGFPGHVVIVMDVAVHDQTGERIFLAAQGFTPAQDFHILVNANDAALNPWYRCNFGDTLITPNWEFAPGQLHYFD